MAKYKSKYAATYNCMNAIFIDTSLNWLLFNHLVLFLLENFSRYNLGLYVTFLRFLKQCT